MPSGKSSSGRSRARARARARARTGTTAPEHAIASTSNPPTDAEVSTRSHPRRDPAWERLPWQKKYVEMAATLTSLDPAFGPREIYNALANHRIANRRVTLTLIDIHVKMTGEHSKTASIRFLPPLINPWESDYITLQKRDASGAIIQDVAKISLEPDRHVERDDTITSPLGKPVERKVDLSVAATHFGIMTRLGVMKPMRTIGRDYVNGMHSRNAVRITADFKRRVLEAHFSFAEKDPGTGEMPREYFKAEIAFSQMRRVFKRVDEKTGLKPRKGLIVLTVEYPPRVFKKLDDPFDGHEDGRLIWTEGDNWIRHCNVVSKRHLLEDVPVSLDEPGQLIDFGRWTTFAWEVLGDPNIDKVDLMVSSLSEFNIETHAHAGLRLCDDPSPAVPMWRPLHHLQEDCRHTNEGFLPFEVLYQLEVCISHHVLSEYTVNESSLKQLKTIGTGPACKILQYIADRGRRIPNLTEFLRSNKARKLMVEHSDPGDEKVDMAPAHCSLIHRAIVTPTGIYFNTPALETNNRVLRQFSHLSDRFLRVLFSDELHVGRVGSAADTKRNDAIYARVMRTLRNGIRVAGRHYELLAFGNSQLRENGAFFFAPINGVTCETIREWMGDFSSIKNVAKYTARLGQCFSSTVDVSGIVGSPDVVRIPDVVHPRGYCFTDGVGKISADLARTIQEQLKLHYRPSAFQVRIGGCKGMLAVWPEVEGNRIHLRPSQEKFVGALSSNLEVVRCSEATVPTLNQQVIPLLSMMGIPDQVFIRLLENEMDGLDAAMKDRGMAIQQLVHRTDEHRMTDSIAQLVLWGFMDANEPFVSALLNLWRSWRLKSLKEKAKITVADGAFVFGCVDETRTLRGHSDNPPKEARGKDRLPQIFLQVQRPAGKGEYRAITGVCLVGRNPSLQLGDLRVVEAVDVPALRHLRDVVVFPMNGDRDIPSMCSGGDLDGDDYFVIWNRDLIPAPPKANHEPLIFSADKPPLVDEVTMDHVRQFFITYMKNDSLGQIALAHRAIADRSSKGVLDNACIKLAALHSKSVDSIKTGLRVMMPRELRPRSWPHWMEKGARSEYHSKRVLGKIYDKVQTHPFEADYSKPFDKRVLDRYPNPDPQLMQAVRKMKTQYDIALQRFLGQMEIATEFEAWTGFIMSRRRYGNDYKYAEDTWREMQAIRQRFRSLCIREAGGSAKFADMAPFVAAMYRVTHEEVRISLFEQSRFCLDADGEVPGRPLISFPWLFQDELAMIATGEMMLPRVRDYINEACLPTYGPAPSDPPYGGAASGEVLTPTKLAPSNLENVDKAETPDKVPSTPTNVGGPAKVVTPVDTDSPDMTEDEEEDPFGPSSMEVPIMMQVPTDMEAPAEAGCLDEDLLSPTKTDASAKMEDQGEDLPAPATTEAPIELETPVTEEAPPESGKRMAELLSLLKTMTLARQKKKQEAASATTSTDLQDNSEAPQKKKKPPPVPPKPEILTMAKKAPAKNMLADNLIEVETEAESEVKKLEASGRGKDATGRTTHHGEPLNLMGPAMEASQPHPTVNDDEYSGEEENAPAPSKKKKRKRSKKNKNKNAPQATVPPKSVEERMEQVEFFLEGRNEEGRRLKAEYKRREEEERQARQAKRAEYLKEASALSEGQEGDSNH